MLLHHTSDTDEQKTACRQSGKFSIAYMAQGGEKEYYVASACKEVYIPESASLSLRGLAVAGLFCRPAWPFKTRTIIATAGL